MVEIVLYVLACSWEAYFYFAHFTF